MLAHASRQPTPWLIFDVGQDMHATKKSSFPRPLTPHEYTVTRWAIDHGGCSQDVRAGYLAQLDRAVVIGECECGCASLDFGVDGSVAQGKDREVLGDFATEDRQYGLCVFASQGLLDGIEVFEMAADAPSKTLPDPKTLTEIEWK